MNSKIKTYSNMEYDSDIADYIHHFGENRWCPQTVNDFSFYLQDKDFAVNKRFFYCCNSSHMELIHNTGVPRTYRKPDEQE